MNHFSAFADKQIDSDAKVYPEFLSTRSQPLLLLSFMIEESLSTAIMRGSIPDQREFSLLK